MSSDGTRIETLHGLEEIIVLEAELLELLHADEARLCGVQLGKDTSRMVLVRLDIVRGQDVKAKEGVDGHRYLQHFIVRYATYGWDVWFVA